MPGNMTQRRHDEVANGRRHRQNPKAPLKSGFPFAAFIENVRSRDKGKGDFVLEGPAAAAKGQG